MTMFIISSLNEVLVKASDSCSKLSQRYHLEDVKADLKFSHSGERMKIVKSEKYLIPPLPF